MAGGLFPNREQFNRHYGLCLAGVSYFKYCSSKSYNEYLGVINTSTSLRKKKLPWSRIKPAMIKRIQYGLDPDQRAREQLFRSREKFIQKSFLNAIYQFEFNLLADPNTINAFCIAWRDKVFITRALFDKLQNKDQLAGCWVMKSGHVTKTCRRKDAKDGLYKGIREGQSA